MISAALAATIIGLPLIEPELSISNVTTVFFDLFLVSFLKDKLFEGL